MKTRLEFHAACWAAYCQFALNAVCFRPQFHVTITKGMENLAQGNPSSSTIMPRLATIKANVLVVIQEKDGAFVAYCPFLNVMTHAETRGQAFENLQEEIRFLFESALTDGAFVELLDLRTAQRRDLFAPADFVQLEFVHADVELPAGIPGKILKRFADAPELSA